MKDTRSINIRYVDDTNLLSAVFEKMQLSTAEQEQACKKWGTKINNAKCKILLANQDPIMINIV